MLAFKPNLLPRCALQYIPSQVHQILRQLYRMLEYISKCAKKKKMRREKEKLREFLQVCILGKAETISS